MSYKTQPWLLTKDDYRLIEVLNKASQWEGYTTRRNGARYRDTYENSTW